MSQYGISLYLGSGYETNRRVVEKAADAGANYAFTSLHIPEESVSDYAAEVNRLLDLCGRNGISLIVDIGPRTVEKLGYRHISDLKQTAVTHLRVDYGFSFEQIIALSEDFNIVFNASTLLEPDIRELRRLGADFSRFSACHNFYPKPLTGLSLKKTRAVNENLRRLGMTTMAFVPGDGVLRGPLREGLPTVEEHRGGDVLLNLLQLEKECLTDVCLVGDIDLSDAGWRAVKELSQGCVGLKAEIRPEYGYIRETVHHDRPDSSDYVIRSQESRGYAAQGRLFAAEPVRPRPKGSISVGNETYLRYSGELEIARVDLQPESRVNIVGHVEESCLKYLPYIADGMGFRFE